MLYEGSYGHLIRRGETSSGAWRLQIRLENKGRGSRRNRSVPGSCAQVSLKEEEVATLLETILQKKIGEVWWRARLRAGPVRDGDSY